MDDTISMFQSFFIKLGNIDPYVALSKNNLVMLKEYYKTHDIFEENDEGKTILEVATEMLENDKDNMKLKDSVDFLRNVEEQSYLILENPEISNDVPPLKLNLINESDVNGFFNFIDLEMDVSQYNIYKNNIFELCKNDSFSNDLLTFLKNNPSTVNENDYYGWTPLHYAARFNSIKCMEILLDHGADINEKNKQDETPIFRAVLYNSKECVKMLLDHGADINSKDNEGNTLLHCIAYSKSKEIAKFLIDYGADTTIKNNEGETFLDLINSENDHLKQEIKKYIEDLQDLDVKTPCEDD